MKQFRIGRQRWEHKAGKWQPVLLEEHVVRELVTRLWAVKIKVWRIRERIPGLSRNLSTPGVPDLIGWVPTRLTASSLMDGDTFSAIPLFIEVKRPGGVRRPAQERWIAEARQDGCIAFFAESWEDCRRELDYFGVKLSA